ncbi:MAG: hypothetical protein LBK71_11480 [Verrucomicrobiales bacterium]|jgi:hypothetical protein|nr:hypothetical protein [Verrucomicrobiales bacterium]
MVTPPGRKVRPLIRPPNDDILSLRYERLTVQDRRQLQARLLENCLLLNEASDIKDSVLDRRVVKKTADAGMTATISGTLTTSKNDGQWKMIKSEVQWAELVSGERREKLGPQTVVAGTDEFDKWATQVSDYAERAGRAERRHRARRTGRCA